MNQNELFKSLVNNALDFLNVAITEIRDRPKYSVIHFYSAVEILLKSRLLIEHWALVWDDPKLADRNKFLKGNFRSVSMDDAVKRLQGIAGATIGSHAVQSFQRLQDHRNQLIHFFHPEYGTDAPEEVIATVVADLCVAWLNIHYIITKLWKAEYSSYAPAISDLNRMMMQLREYLTVRYKNVKPDIAKGIERGVQFEDCSSCGFDAARVTERMAPLVHTFCIVCESNDARLEVQCPQCGEVIQIYELGEGTCSKCATHIEMGYLIETFGTKQTRYEAQEDPSHGYCTNCEWPEDPTVVPWEDQYLCLNCFSIYEYLEYCEWCNEKNAGDMSDSFLSGCVLCDGRFR